MQNYLIRHLTRNEDQIDCKEQNTHLIKLTKTLQNNMTEGLCVTIYQCSI